MQKQPKSPIVQFFSANSEGRDFVAGDIHGHFEMLEALLCRIGFNERTDRLFVTGDLIDRGPYSHEVVNWLDKPWVHSIRGNHEQMVLDCQAGVGDPPRHSRNGGRWFHEREPQEQQEIASRLAALPIAMEVELRSGRRVGIIHAELPGWEEGVDWSGALALLGATDPEQQRHAVTQALYARARISSANPRPVDGIEKLYVGHSTVPDILRLGNVIYIDTGCSFEDGKLTLIDLHSEEAFSEPTVQRLLCS